MTVTQLILVTSTCELEGAKIVVETKKETPTKRESHSRQNKKMTQTDELEGLGCFKSTRIAIKASSKAEDRKSSRRQAT